MPLLPFDQVQQMGPWTPGAPYTPGSRNTLAMDLTTSNSLSAPAQDRYDRRSRSPGVPLGYEIAAEYNERARSTSRPPSRRHTLESTSSLLGPPPVPMHGSGENSSRSLGFNHYGHESRTGYFEHDDARRFPGWSNPHVFLTEQPRRHVPGAAFMNPTDVRVSHLRPELGFSTFDANHEAIMSTIPGSRSGSRQPSRSNSPHMSRVNSRSRLGNLLGRNYSSSSLSLEQRDGTGRNSRAGRSRDRNRMEEEPHQEGMLRALAEAASTQQARTELSGRQNGHQMELPVLPSEIIEPIPVTVTSAEEFEALQHSRSGRQTHSRDTDDDVTMTQ